MKIFLSQYAGFCPGVKRAFDMVMSLDMEKIKKPVLILGALVHNEDVNKRIKEKGIGEITLEELKNSLSGEIGTLIVTAHGDGPEIFALAKGKKIDVIDTTCPKVIKVQRLANVFSKRKMKVVIVGDKGHKETRGIQGWSGGNSLIVSSENLSQSSLLSKNKIAILSQTTQDEIFFEKVCREIKKNNSSAVIENTICLTSKERQEEIKKMAGKNDAVLVVGSPSSANSKRLFEIARQINKKTFFVENANQIKKEWFYKIYKLAITAGASTPKWIIEEIVDKIKNLYNKKLKNK